MRDRSQDTAVTEWSQGGEDTGEGGGDTGEGNLRGYRSELSRRVIPGEECEGFRGYRW